MASTELLSKLSSDGSLEECIGSSDLENRKPEESVSPEILQSAAKSEEVKNDINELLENIPQLKKMFIISDKIGSGTFSSVYLACLKSRPSESLYALKHIIPTSHPSRIENELKCLLDIGGRDNVIEVKACFRERDNVVIVMPYFAHDKFQNYVDRLQIDEIQLYMKSLLVALSRVHSIDLIHRDVKPSNFLFHRASKRFALVDFGLAQRAPVPLKSKVNDSSMKLPSEDVSDKTDALKPKEGCAKRPSGSPRKRKLDSTENGVSPRPSKVPCLEKVEDAVKRSTEADPGKDPSVDVDRRLQPLDQNRLAPLSFTTSTAVFKSTYSKSIKSPRRALLTRRMFDAHKELPDNTPKGKRVSPPGGRKDLAMPRQADDLSSATTRRASVSGVCGCYGKPTVCSICLYRSIQQAPRAGTPGFRAPEVLMKFPNQSTAVDIWSAGVIFLSLLSGRYPFFKASDDMTSLAQIVSVFGFREAKAAAATYGKQLMVSPEVVGNNLKELCEQLRCSGPMPRKKDGRTGSPVEMSKTRVIVPDSAYDLLERLLDLNPFTRITADEALKHKFFGEDLQAKSDAELSRDYSGCIDLCMKVPKISIDH